MNNKSKITKPNKQTKDKNSLQGGSNLYRKKLTNYQQQDYSQIVGVKLKLSNKIHKKEM